MKYEGTIKKSHINENFSINTIIDDIMDLCREDAQRALNKEGVTNPHANNVMSIFAQYYILDKVEGKTLYHSQYKVLKVNSTDGVSKSVMILAHKDGGRIALKVNKKFFTKKQHDNGTIKNSCLSQLKAEYEFYKNATTEEKKYLARVSKYFQYKGVLCVECADYVFDSWKTTDMDKLQTRNDYAEFKTAIEILGRKYGLWDILTHIDNIGIFQGKLKALDYGITR